LESSSANGAEGSKKGTKDSKVEQIVGEEGKGAKVGKRV